MFGYVNIYKPELKVKDYTRYRAYYCGLCRTLKDEYGSLSRLSLSYDMTFLILLLSSVYEGEEFTDTIRCIAHPVDKRPIIINEITSYVADMNIVLMYYKFVDDYKDDGNKRAVAGIRILRKRFMEIEKRYPKRCAHIKKALTRLSMYEREESTNLDEVAGQFGLIMSELFAYKNDIFNEDLRKTGFYLGKYIYILDAYDDLNKDIDSNSYNPLKNMRQSMSQEEFDKQCEDILTMMMAQCTTYYEKLPCVLNSDILKNILYVGVWNKFDKKRKENNNDK